MKKLLVILSLCILSFSSIWIQNSFAEQRTKSAIVKDIILKKRELEKNSPKWELYVQALDAYFEKYQDNSEKINSLLNKVSVAKVKLWNSAKENEIRLLIEYIEYKAELVEIIPWQEINVLMNNTQPYVAVFHDFVKYLNTFDGNAIKSISTQKFITEMEDEWLDLDNLNAFFLQQGVKSINWEIVSIQENNETVILGVILVGINIDWTFERENNPDYISLVKIQGNWYLDTTKTK